MKEYGRRHHRSGAGSNLIEDGAGPCKTVAL